MLNGKKVLAIVPARAGSKRVINKNFRNIAGLPLIAWTLKDLKSSKYIDHIYVSTDSTEIQRISKDFGVECEPLRPSELATDHTSSFEVVLDIVNNIKPGFDIILLLQPTSPLRSLENIDQALELFAAKGAHSVTSVCETESHPSWCSPLPSDFSIGEMVKNLQVKRSQDLETYYRLNGAIYIISAEEFQSARSFFAEKNAFAYRMSRIDSLDIDTEEDLFLAECILKSKMKMV